MYGLTVDRSLRAMSSAPDSDVTIVLDNGASHIKAGFAGADAPKFIMPNCVARPRNERYRKLVGDETEKVDLVGDFSQLLYSRPFERGYLVNWEHQITVWDRIFSQDYLALRDASNATLMVTEPAANLPRFKAEMDEVAFEYYGFARYARSTTSWLAAQHYVEEQPKSIFAESACRLVVDSGFSSTSVVPVFDNFCVQASVKRVGVGGKAVTNLLKEMLTFRHLPLMEEWYVVNELKETACRVPRNYSVEARRIVSSGASFRYLLPDFQTVHKGRVLGGDNSSGSSSVDDSKDTGEQSGDNEASWDPEQILNLTTEIIKGPELLFNPIDVGIQQGGIVDAIIQSIKSCHPDLTGPLLSNILLVGGNAKLPGFRERVEQDLRAVTPDHFPIGVNVPKDPVGAAWRGASSVASADDFKRQVVSKAEYEEHGHSVCQRRFLR